MNQGLEKGRTVRHRTTPFQHAAQIEEVDTDGLACLRAGDVRDSGAAAEAWTIPGVDEDVGAMNSGAGR